MELICVQIRDLNKVVPRRKRINKIQKIKNIIFVYSLASRMGISQYAYLNSVTIFYLDINMPDPIYLFFYVSIWTK